MQVTSNSIYHILLDWKDDMNAYYHRLIFLMLKREMLQYTIFDNIN